MSVKHFSVKDHPVFHAMLFVPSSAPCGRPEIEKKGTNIKVHVGSRCIVDGCDKLIPWWSSFITGVGDFSEMATERPQETLQQNKILRTMKKILGLKRLDMLPEFDERKRDDRDSSRLQKCGGAAVFLFELKECGRRSQVQLRFCRHVDVLWATRSVTDPSSRGQHLVWMLVLGGQVEGVRVKRRVTVPWRTCSLVCGSDLTGPEVLLS